MVVLDPVLPLLSEEKFQQRQGPLTCHGQATKPFQNLQATLSKRLGLGLPSLDNKDIVVLPLYPSFLWHFVCFLL